MYQAPGTYNIVYLLSVITGVVIIKNSIIKEYQKKTGNTSTQDPEEIAKITRSRHISFFLVFLLFILLLSISYINSTGVFE